MVRLPRKEKQTYPLNPRPQMWPMGLTLAMTLTFEFSRSNVIFTICWPRSGVKDLPDRYWGDFRCWRAIDSSRLWILRQIPFYWFSLFCSHDSACNSYRRSHMSCHIEHAGFVRQHNREWPGWWFIPCSPPVGGVVCLSLGLKKHFGGKNLFIHLNTLRQRENGCHFPDNIFKCIFFNENVWISIKISLKFVPKGLINNIPALVQIMAWGCQATSPCLNQWWLVYWHIYASLGLNQLSLFFILWCLAFCWLGAPFTYVN